VVHAALVSLSLSDCRSGPLHDVTHDSLCVLGAINVHPCRTVDMVARHDLEPGDAVTLDYGGRPMRDMLRNYGCVLPAAESPHEVSTHKQLIAAMHVGSFGCQSAVQTMCTAISDDHNGSPTARSSSSQIVVTNATAVAQPAPR